MKLYCASAEDNRDIAILYTAAKLTNTKPCLLASYYYLQTPGTAAPFIAAQNLKDIDWILDSGVFTMVYGSNKGEVFTYKKVENFTNKYLDFVQQHRYKGYFVEMDVHKVLDMKSVFKLRKLIEARCGVNNCIFVWHVEEKIEGLVALAKRYPYIAIAVSELRKLAAAHKKDARQMLYSLLHIIHETANPVPKIHLLGCSQPSLMMNNLYTSVDSTSWFSGAVYNSVKLWVVNKFKATNMKNAEYKKLLSLYEDRIMKELADYEHKTKQRVMQFSYLKEMTLQAIAFKQFENYVNKQFSQERKAK